MDNQHSKKSPFTITLTVLTLATLASCLIWLFIDPDFDSFLASIAALTPVIAYVTLKNTIYNKRLDMILSVFLILFITPLILYITIIRSQEPPITETDLRTETRELPPSEVVRYPIIYGPTSIYQELKHRKINTIEFSCANVSVKNFIAEVKFYNPHDRQINPWDYGIAFRMSSNDQYRFTIGSNQRIGFGAFQEGQGNVKFEAFDDSVDNTPNGTNIIKIQANNQTATISINGKYSNPNGFAKAVVCLLAA